MFRILFIVCKSKQSKTIFIVLFIPFYSQFVVDKYQIDSWLYSILLFTNKCNRYNVRYHVNKKCSKQLIIQTYERRFCSFSIYAAGNMNRLSSRYLKQSTVYRYNWYRFFDKEMICKAKKNGYRAMKNTKIHSKRQL